MYNHAWNRLRNAYLMQHPLCEDCLSNGIYKMAQECHHILPISAGKDKLDKLSIMLDASNLRALCEDCHHKIHNNNRTKKH